MKNTQPDDIDRFFALLKDRPNRDTGTDRDGKSLTRRLSEAANAEDEAERRRRG